MDPMADIDICNHPACLLAFTGGYVDPDDTPRIRRRLRQRGFSTEQQDEIVYELQWAWIEQPTAMEEYLTLGFWFGYVCSLHGPRTISTRRRRRQKQLHRRLRHGDKPKGGPPQPHREPVSAQELSSHDAAHLAVAAECVVMSAWVDTQYMSENEDGERSSKRTDHHPPTPVSHCTDASVPST